MLCDLATKKAWREIVPEPLWRPSADRIADANITAFARQLESDWGVALPDYPSLHAFSLNEMDKFWSTVWDFCGVVAETKGERILLDGDRMPGAKFFPDARLNFAENLLGRRDDSPAIVFRAEDMVKRQLTWNELYEEVSRLAQAMRALEVLLVALFRWVRVVPQRHRLTRAISTRCVRGDSSPGWQPSR